jgi:hypothetical protein
MSDCIILVRLRLQGLGDLPQPTNTHILLKSLITQNAIALATLRPSEPLLRIT